jgi:hypothetical protein
MLDYLTAHSIANDIRMRRTLHKGSFLVLEGGTDATLFKRFVNGQECQIVVAGGRDRVLLVVGILDGEKFQGALGIADSDFANLEGKPLPSPNIILTEFSDIELILISSSALERVINEFASERKSAEFSRSHAKDMRQILLEASMSVGYFRWANDRENLSLKFRELRFDDFAIVKTRVEIDTNKLLRALKLNSTGCLVTEAELQRKLDDLRRISQDPWQICNGHDAVRFLAMILGKIGRGRNPIIMEPDTLEKILRLAFERADFEKTKLFSAIRAWESGSGFVVLMA